MPREADSAVDSRPNMRSLLVAVLLLLAGVASAEDDEVKAKAVRMKTSRQLKEILTELGIDHGGLDKDGLRALALREDAVTKWEELHPEKKRKPRSQSPFGNMGAAPEGMDPVEWERLMAQMRGDFSHEQDPEKRRILNKLKGMGMSFGGGSDMDLEQLKNLEKAMGNLGDLKGGAPKDEM